MQTRQPPSKSMAQDCFGQQRSMAEMPQEKATYGKHLNFAKNFVANAQPAEASIPVDPFRLNQKDRQRPTAFYFELAIGEAIYEFSFSVTQSDVVEEKLVKVQPASEDTIYHRKIGDPDPHLGTQFGREIRDRLQYAFQGTDRNQLFLTNATGQKVDEFRPIFDWFRKTLTLIGPTSAFGPIEILGNKRGTIYTKMSRMLARLDTGVAHLDQENVSWEKVFPEAIRKEIRRNISKNSVARVESPWGERFTLSMSNGELLAKKLVSCHMDKDGAEVRFDMNDESDGTRRLIDILPAFIALCDPTIEKVFVIDELDRSLHTLLTRTLLETYLSTCSPRLVHSSYSRLTTCSLWISTYYAATRCG